MIIEAGDGFGEQRLIAEADKGLGDVGAEALARPGRDDHGPDGDRLGHAV
jgi:hypothetical protein